MFNTDELYMLYTGRIDSTTTN